jgi:hypothetical protein
MLRKLFTPQFSIIQVLGYNNLKGFLIFALCTLGILQSGQAQSIKNDVLFSGAFEAEFHFDVFYSIVDCDGTNTLLITTFNESGAKTDVGFDIEFADAIGNKQTFQVPIFKSKMSEMLQTSCGSNQHAFLKFPVTKDFDFKTISGTIKFYSK